MPGLFVFQIVFESKPQVAGRDPRFGRIGRELIARDLFLNELVVRFVFIEGADDVIAISPGIVAIAIVLKASGIGVANHIQPVPAPSLAVVRRSKQLFHHL